MAREGAHPDDVTTPQATTPSGGRHLVYAANGAAYRNNVKLDGSAIDLRTDGGYIVLPVRQQRPHVAQAALYADRAGPEMDSAGAGRRDSPARRGASLHRRDALRPRGARDAPARRSRRRPTARRSPLSTRNAISIGGLVGGGDLEIETAIAALTAAANAMPTYRDPWRDLETKVRRAVTEGMREPRTTPDQSVPREPDALIWYGDAPPTPPNYLVDETLPEIGLATIGGQYGAAKTFVGADLASAIMVGGDFAGKIGRAPRRRLVARR